MYVFQAGQEVVVCLQAQLYPLVVAMQPEYQVYLRGLVGAVRPSEGQVLDPGDAVRGLAFNGEAYMCQRRFVMREKVCVCEVPCSVVESERITSSAETSIDSIE